MLKSFASGKNRVVPFCIIPYFCSMNTVLIPKPALFSFDECCWFLNRNYDDCLHHIEPGKLSKAICINDLVVVFSVQEDEQYLVVKILQSEPVVHGSSEIVNKSAKPVNESTKPANRSARRVNSNDGLTNSDALLSHQLTLFVTDWFDLDRDLQPFYRLLQKNKALGYMADDYKGFRLISIHDLFEALCWSIIGQQINLTFAYSLKRRLVEQYGKAITADGKTFHLFPRPEVLQSLTVAELRPLQFSERKAEYLIHLAQLFAAGSMSMDHLRSFNSYEEQVAQLTAIRGIGVWTANYALMKSLKQMQAIPHGDVGLLNALSSHQLIKDRKDLAAINKLFKGFKGWESYLVFYLWRSLSKA